MEVLFEWSCDVQVGFCHNGGYWGRGGGEKKGIPDRDRKYKGKVPLTNKYDQHG